MSKVLLIEDEAGIRRTLTVSLMQEGYEVEPCEDGLSGLARMSNYTGSGKNFDAVILDINLPDISGLKVLRFLKEKHPDIPVIMMTGYGDEATEQEIRERKGDAYLEKPIVMNKLDDYLHSLIARKEEILGADAVSSADEVKMTTKSGYAFIKMSDEDQFLPVYQKLYFNENVMYCDATRGVFDIVLLLHGKSVAEMEEVTEKIRKMRGVDQVYFAAVEKPVLSDDFAKVIAEMEKFLMENNNSSDFKGMGDCQCSAYAFLEIEPEAFEAVYRHVYFMDNVVSCDTLNGPFKMSLLLKAPTFMEIDEMVTGNIARIDGVLRATQCNIIKLLEM